MIQDNDEQRFEFGNDDDVPEAILQEELQELKIEKLSQRVTLLTILIPCMIGVILIITYLDIKDRVTRTYDTGAIGVQKLSKDLDSKFSSLSLEQAKIKDVYAKKIPALEQSTAYLKSRLTKIQKSLDQAATSRVSRDELTGILEGLNKKLNEIPESIKSDMTMLKQNDRQLTADTKKLFSNSNEISKRLSEIKDSLETLKADISSLNDVKIDKDDLDLALKLKEISYRQQLLETKSAIDKKIDVIQKQMESIQNKTGQTGIKSTNTTDASPSVTEKKTSPPSEAKSEKDSASTTDNTQNEATGEKSAAVKGGIVEQTIE